MYPAAKPCLAAGSTSLYSRGLTPAFGEPTGSLTSKVLVSEFPATSVEAVRQVVSAVSGQPLAQGFVSLRQEVDACGGRGWAGPVTWRYERSVFVTADEAGRFVVDLPAGTYEADADLADTNIVGRYVSTSNAARAPQTDNALVNVARGAASAVTLIFEPSKRSVVYGLAEPGTIVTFRPSRYANRPQFTSARTDAQGRFSVSLAPGPYSMSLFDAANGETCGSSQVVGEALDGTELYYLFNDGYLPLSVSGEKLDVRFSCLTIQEAWMRWQSRQAS